MPTSSPEERSGILAFVSAAGDVPETERYAAKAAAAQDLLDLITQVRCHADGSVTVWTGEWGFRIRIEGDVARIEGGVETVGPGEVMALRWETRAGTFAEPFLPMRIRS